MIRLGRWLTTLFFILMLIFPTVLQLERGILLALILSGAVFVILRAPERWRVAKPILAWLLICVWVSIFGIANGIVNSAPGAIAVGTVYVLWPILYVFFIGFSKNHDTYIRLEKTLIIGIAIVALSCLLLIGSSYFSFISAVLYPYFDLLKSGTGFYEGYTELRIISLATIIYGIPFLLTMVASKKTMLMGGFSKNWYYFSLVVLLISALLIILAGRRAFILVCLLSVPLVVIVNGLTRLQPIGYKLAFKLAYLSMLIVGVGLFTSMFFFDIDFQLVLYEFVKGFHFDDSSNVSAYRRTVQFEALIDGWLKSPIIGAGHGAAAADKIGYSEQAWAYELQYIALLFQTGILGISVYGSAVLWLVYQMVRLSRSYKDLAVLMVPALVGLLCFLVANATNPYLSKFDYLWVIFLPTGLVNVGLLRENKQSSLVME